MFRANLIKVLKGNVQEQKILIKDLLSLISDIDDLIFAEVKDLCKNVENYTNQNLIFVNIV